ncbi:MAG: DNA gyrase/topoisomerase IV subunit A, partial [Flavobacteriaceae bacterium]|nr:DNA gyrase/topoisomerase IV subunit A [Flavobacteriaceae bacterium]
DKDEKFISDHPNSKLQIVAVDYRPMAEVIFSKRSLENEKLNFEEFIAIKGIKSLGNQLTTDKIKQINLLDPLPYEEPEINDVDLVDEEVIDNENKGQTTMFE